MSMCAKIVCWSSRSDAPAARAELIENTVECIIGSGRSRMEISGTVGEPGPLDTRIEDAIAAAGFGFPYGSKIFIDIHPDERAMEVALEKGAKALSEFIPDENLESAIATAILVATGQIEEPSEAVLSGKLNPDGTIEFSEGMRRHLERRVPEPGVMTSLSNLSRPEQDARGNDGQPSLQEVSREAQQRSSATFERAASKTVALIR